MPKMRRLGWKRGFRKIRTTDFFDELRVHQGNK
jgi:hypothetical protein